MIYDEKPWLKHFDPMVPPEVEVSDGVVSDLFDQVVAEFGPQPALFFHGVMLTFAEVMRHADRVAQALVSHGCRPGDVVAINLPNIPDYLIAQLGTIKAGCAATGVSPLLTPAEMAYQLRDSGAKALFTLDAIFQHRLASELEGLDQLRLVVGSGLLDFLPAPKRLLGRWLKKVPTGRLAPVGGKSVLSFQRLLESFPAEPVDVRVTPDDPLLVQYTGGTTGFPKGALLTQRSLLANLEQFTRWLQLERGRERFLSAFPLFHLAGLAVGLGAVMIGAPQVLIPDPRNVGHIIKELKAHRPTLVANVPSLYMMLLDEPKFAKVSFSALKCCIAGAAPFPVSAFTKLERILGRGKLVEVYGMTETSPLITMNPLHGQKKVGTVGLPISSTRIRLVDLETGNEPVKLGEEGEIIVNGPQVMNGYFNKPEETAKAMREHDGEIWFHTGDVARMDADGYFQIVDRCKDMVIVSGYKVFSSEVEDKLHHHPDIDLCAVVGVPNPEREGSELVKLVVQRTESAHAQSESATRESILGYAREKLSTVKVPKIIEFVDSLPLTAVGKVNKKVLR